MILFHYTSGLLIEKILLTGLRKGSIPWSMNSAGIVGMQAGFQWLTQSPDFDQEWARPSPFSTLPFRRDEIRITISIPAQFQERVISFSSLMDTNHPQSETFLKSFGGWQHWRLFRGVIPPPWFVEITKNPTPPQMILPERN